MSDYGVKETGFVLKPLSQILADINARQDAASEIGPEQDKSTASPLGQINGTIASEIAEAWEVLALVYKAGDPDGATGVPLVELLSLTAADPREAAPTRVIGALLTLDPGTTVFAGSQVSIVNRPDLTFTLDADVSAATGATGPAQYSGDFTSTVDGPTAVAAATLTVIDTSVGGWTAITNPEPGSTGRNADGNVEIRARWARSRARNGSTTAKAIRARFTDTDTVPEFAAIEDVIILENKTDATDANGLPPHSLEVILDDGPTPIVDNELIAQVILDECAAAGIDTHGSTSAEAEDSEGEIETVRFSRVVRRAVHIGFEITVGSLFPSNGLDQVKAAFATAGNGLGIDNDVIALYIQAQALSVAGVTDVAEFAIGFASSPTEAANLSIGYRERATFDVANMNGLVI